MKRIAGSDDNDGEKPIVPRALSDNSYADGASSENDDGDVISVSSASYTDSSIELSLDDSSTEFSFADEERLFGDKKKSKDNNSKSTDKDNSPKQTILCLHGHSSNGDIATLQLDNLSLSKYFEIHILHGPIKYNTPADDSVALLSSGPYYSWMTPTSRIVDSSAADNGYDPYTSLDEPINLDEIISDRTPAPITSPLNEFQRMLANANNDELRRSTNDSHGRLTRRSSMGDLTIASDNHDRWQQQSRLSSHCSARRSSIGSTIHSTDQIRQQRRFSLSNHSPSLDEPINLDEIISSPIPTSIRSPYNEYQTSLANGNKYGLRRSTNDSHGIPTRRSSMGESTNASDDHKRWQQKRRLSQSGGLRSSIGSTIHSTDQMQQQRRLSQSSGSSSLGSTIHSILSRARHRSSMGSAGSQEPFVDENDENHDPSLHSLDLDDIFGQPPPSPSRDSSTHHQSLDICTKSSSSKQPRRLSLGQESSPRHIFSGTPEVSTATQVLHSASSGDIHRQSSLLINSNSNLGLVGDQPIDATVTYDNSDNAIARRFAQYRRMVHRTPERIAATFAPPSNESEPAASKRGQFDETMSSLRYLLEHLIDRIERKQQNNEVVSLEDTADETSIMDDSLSSMDRDGEDTRIDIFDIDYDANSETTYNDDAFFDKHKLKKAFTKKKKSVQRPVVAYDAVYAFSQSASLVSILSHEHMRKRLIRLFKSNHVLGLKNATSPHQESEADIETILIPWKFVILGCAANVFSYRMVHAYLYGRHVCSIPRPISSPGTEKHDDIMPLKTILACDDDRLPPHPEVIKEDAFESESSVHSDVSIESSELLALLAQDHSQTGVMDQKSPIRKNYISGAMGLFEGAWLHHRRNAAASTTAARDVGPTCLCSDSNIDDIESGTCGVCKNPLVDTEGKDAPIRIPTVHFVGINDDFKAESEFYFKLYHSEVALPIYLDASHEIPSFMREMGKIAREVIHWQELHIPNKHKSRVPAVEDDSHLDTSNKSLSSHDSGMEILKSADSFSAQDLPVDSIPMDGTNRSLSSVKSMPSRRKSSLSSWVPLSSHSRRSSIINYSNHSACNEIKEKSKSSPTSRKYLRRRNSQLNPSNKSPSLHDTGTDLTIDSIPMDGTNRSLSSTKSFTSDEETSSSTSLRQIISSRRKSMPSRRRSSLTSRFALSSHSRRSSIINHSNHSASSTHSRRSSFISHFNHTFKFNKRKSKNDTVTPKDVSLIRVNNDMLDFQQRRDQRALLDVFQGAETNVMRADTSTPRAQYFLNDIVTESFTDLSLLSLLTGSSNLDDSALYSPGNDDQEPSQISYNEIISFIKGKGDLRRLLATGSSLIAYVPPPGAGGILSAMAFLTITSQCAAAPLDPSYSESDFIAAFKQLKPSMVIVFDPNDPEPVQRAAQEVGCRCYVASQMDDEKTGFFTYKDPTTRREAPDVSRAMTNKPHLVNSGDSVGLLLRTSGTTSKPKVVPLKVGSIVSNARIIAKNLGLTASDVALNAMPLFHIGGIAANLLSSLAAGASCIMALEFSAPSFLNMLTTENEYGVKPTWYSAVPTMHSSITAAAESMQGLNPKAFKHNLRFIRTGAAAMPHDLAQKIEVVFNCPVILTYSMTEQMPISQPPQGLSLTSVKPGSVGQPIATSLLIVNKELRPVPFGDDQIGEVCISSPLTFEGYESNQSANTKAFFYLGSMKWFRTGDMGYLDKDGFLFLTGRNKEMIKRGGEQINPIEIEEFCAKQHEAIKMCVAFAIPDKVWGQRLGLAVVLKEAVVESGNYPKEDDLLRELRRTTVNQNIQAFKAPEKVVYVDESELPMTASKKIIRVGLADKLGVESMSDDVLDRLQDLRPFPHISDALSGVRFVLALAVMYGHIGDFGEQLNRARAFCMHVPGFFFIGGFMLAAGAKNTVITDYKSFWTLRLSIIHPMYMVALVCAIVNFVLRCNPGNYIQDFELNRMPEEGTYYVCQSPIVEQPYGWAMFSSIIVHIFALQAWPFSLLISWFIFIYPWFQSVYYFCLFCFPFLHKPFHTRRRNARDIWKLIIRWLIGNYVMVVIFRAYFPLDAFNPDVGNIFGLMAYFFPPGWLPCFAIGVGSYFLFAIYRPNEKIQAWVWGICTDLLSCVFLVMFFIIGFLPDQTTPERIDKPFDKRYFAYFLSRITAPAIFVWIFGLAVGRGLTAKLLSHKLIVVWLAPASYNMYLFHQVVQEWYYLATRQVWWVYPKSYYWFSPKQTPVPWWEFLIILAITIALSVFLEVYVNGYLVKYSTMAVKYVFRIKDKEIDDSNVHDAVISILKNITGVDEISSETNLIDTGLSSMTTLLLISDVQRTYPSIKLSTRDVLGAGTVGRLVEIVHDLTVQKSILETTPGGVDNGYPMPIDENTQHSHHDDNNNDNRRHNDGVPVRGTTGSEMGAGDTSSHILLI